MKSFLNWLGAGILLVVATVVALFLATSGDYPVPALVTEDASRPAQKIAGVTLHMQITEGPAEAPTLIVLHGGPGGDFRSLRALEAMSDSYTTVFYDQRGAGLSERMPPEALTLDAHIAELYAVIEHLSPERPVILLGHSWGAMLATAYLGQHAERVQSAVLIEPGYLDETGRQAWQTQSQAYLSGPAYWREALLTGFRAQHVTDPNAREDYLIGHMVGVFANHPENPYHCGNGYTAPHWRFGAATSNRWSAAPADEVDQIALGTAFPGPVLILAGACNDWIGPALQATHAARFPNAELVTIPAAGHDLVWDNPEATLAVIRTFLNGD